MGARVDLIGCRVGTVRSERIGGGHGRRCWAALAILRWRAGVKRGRNGMMREKEMGEIGGLKLLKLSFVPCSGALKG